MAHKSNNFGETSSPKERTNVGSSRLFVGDLLAGTTESQLYNYFRKFGALQQVFIPHSVRGKSKMFAFVQFETHHEAERALAQSQVAPFTDGHFLRVELAVPEEIRTSSPGKQTRFKVVLSNIPKGTDMQEIADLVSVFGPFAQTDPLLYV